MTQYPYFWISGKQGAVHRFIQTGINHYTPAADQNFFYTTQDCFIGQMTQQLPLENTHGGSFKT